LVFVLVLGFPLPVFPQSPAEDNSLKHGQGLILDTEDDLANIPRTPDYRASYPTGLTCPIGFQHPAIKASKTRVSGGRPHTLAHITPAKLRGAI
jgi:hypothetical protein